MFADLRRQTPRQKKGSYELVKHSSKQKTLLPRRRSVISGLDKPAGSGVGCRYEIKYRISESKAEAIAQFIKPYLHLDRYCKSQSDKAYPIVSLYLDSDNLQLCQESLQGHKNRFKLRIRSYTDEPDYPRFFEIKRRMNTVIIKNRARVRHQDVATALSGLFVLPQNVNGDDETLKQFLLYMNSIKAKPLVKIRYIRRAYEDDTDNRVRVTFDRQLAYNISRKPEVMLNGQGWQRHRFGWVILEIKFTARYPAWLSRMVEYFDLQAQSTSKYVSSVKDACSLGFCAPRLSGQGGQ